MAARGGPGETTTSSKLLPGQGAIRKRMAGKDVTMIRYSNNMGSDRKMKRMLDELHAASKKTEEFEEFGPNYPVSEKQKQLKRQKLDPTLPATVLSVTPERPTLVKRTTGSTPTATLVISKADLRWPTGSATPVIKTTLRDRVKSEAQTAK